jgi:hypothetical protein
MTPREFISLKAVDEVWLATSTPNGKTDGMMCFEAGSTYHLRIAGQNLLDVSDYCFDELVVATRDVYTAVAAGSFEVLTFGGDHHERGYN